MRQRPVLRLVTLDEEEPPDEGELDAAAAGRGAALLGRYCDGDTAAFHELHGWLAPRLLSYLTGLCNDATAAEDLLQLTFLKLHRSRPAYVRGANPIPWLYTIARTVFLDEVRRRRRSRLVLAASEEGPPEARAHFTGAPEAAGPDEALATAAAAQGAVRALSALPGSQREAILLTKVHGRSLAEAAAITGTTVGAMKLRVHRGYVSLRRMLAPVLDGEPEGGA